MKNHKSSLGFFRRILITGSLLAGLAGLVGCADYSLNIKTGADVEKRKYSLKAIPSGRLVDREFYFREGESIEDTLGVEFCPTDKTSRLFYPDKTVSLKSKEIYLAVRCVNEEKEFDLHAGPFTGGLKATGSVDSFVEFCLPECEINVGGESRTYYPVLTKDGVYYLFDKSKTIFEVYPNKDIALNGKEVYRLVLRDSVKITEGGVKRIVEKGRLLKYMIEESTLWVGDTTTHQILESTVDYEVDVLNE